MRHDISKERCKFNKSVKYRILSELENQTFFRDGKKYITKRATLESSSKDLHINQTFKVWKTCSKTVIIYLRTIDLFYAKMFDYEKNELDY